MTVGASFLSQTIALQDSTTVKFEIWDTAGQERYCQPSFISDLSLSGLDSEHFFFNNREITMS